MTLNMAIMGGNLVYSVMLLKSVTLWSRRGFLFAFLVGHAKAQHQAHHLRNGTAVCHAHGADLPQR